MRLFTSTFAPAEPVSVLALLVVVCLGTVDLATVKASQNSANSVEAKNLLFSSWPTGVALLPVPGVLPVASPTATLTTSTATTMASAKGAPGYLTTSYATSLGLPVLSPRPGPAWTSYYFGGANRLLPPASTLFYYIPAPIPAAVSAPGLQYWSQTPNPGQLTETAASQSAISSSQTDQMMQNPYAQYPTGQPQPQQQQQQQQQQHQQPTQQIQPMRQGQIDPQTGWFYPTL